MNDQHTEFERLLATAIEGRADEPQLEQLRALLRDDRELRAEYAAQLQLHALLQWHAGTVSADAAEAKVIPFRPARVHWWLAAAAATVAALGAALWLSQPAKQSHLARQGQMVELEVLEAAAVVVNDEPANYQEGARLALSRLEMQSGMLRFRLSSGAVVTVNGAADVQFIDSMRLRVSRGQLTADVGDHAKGFVVETAQTHVVDLGTKFGIDVADSGHTDVVVFQGEVELFDRKGRHRRDALMSRLVEGEAVRVDARQQLSRIVNVTSGPRDEEWSTRDARDSSSLIASVRDNLRDPQAKYFYRIVPGGLQEDAPAFIGQRHEWNGLDAAGIPPWLLGADLVQTFVSDRFKTQLEITVTVTRPAVIYAFFDNRHHRPAWLAERFTDTGAKIGLENAPAPSSGLSVAKGPGAGHLAACSVWKCELPQGGSITLGPPREAGEESADQKPYWNWMYGIAAKPLVGK